ncbi:hypothetical protein [Jidongwangia harbinensis]|uniref:hypothetical protein n=1 Tax=Jidongwangia harbinensis TaxID=2878561 RepID=UPI001CD9AF76|nr:hypothetical protein [Jidongwangia harbinensis]MCA2213910.1 hypothetical protein [Jidongwangia harbinensis]
MSSTTAAVRPPAGSRTRGSRTPPRELLTWVRVQGDNTERHLAALRPFTRAEFGAGPEAPTEGHVQAANELIDLLRGNLQTHARRLHTAVTAATNVPVAVRLREVVGHKQNAHTAATRAEQIWDFYFELFGMRQSRFGPWLLGCDRIALDCYQYAYLGLGRARSIPAPPAFSYMRTGFSPATFRRGIPLRRLGRQLNPFPLIQLPYHRLVNPWTLGAILHEVSHNLQNDLGLARAVPLAIADRLTGAGLRPEVVAVWLRWHRETFADLAGLLLGGPAVAASLMDVIGRGHRAVSDFSPRSPHPTPYLRVFLSVELLRRLGLTADAALTRQIWTRLYPRPVPGAIPAAVLSSFAEAHRLVVDAICFTPYAPLGNRTLARTLRFEAKEQQMIEEAARRLAAGNDPGVVPERFLIGAARFALDRRLAAPELITTNFYRELARR